MERIKLPRSNSQLAILNQAKIKLNALRCQWPCGIRSIDDETDRKINSLTEFIKDLESRIETV